MVSAPTAHLSVPSWAAPEMAGQNEPIKALDFPRKSLTWLRHAVSLETCGAEGFLSALWQEEPPEQRSYARPYSVAGAVCSKR
jgi:hypothetical protein